jgi:hypothetical protein
VAGADLAAEGLRLADFRAIAGTGFLYARLAKPFDSIASGGYRDELGAARNLLFLETATQQAHWLLPNNAQTLTSFSFLMDPPRDGSESDPGEPDGGRRALAILLELAPARHDGDPPDARRTLAVASPDGRQLATLVEASEGLLGWHQAARDSALVFYVSGGAAQVLELDPTTRTKRSDRVLSVRH